MTQDSTNTGSTGPQTKRAGPTTLMDDDGNTFIRLPDGTYSKVTDTFREAQAQKVGFMRAILLFIIGLTALVPAIIKFVGELRQARVDLVESRISAERGQTQADKLYKEHQNLKETHRREQELRGEAELAVNTAVRKIEELKTSVKTLSDMCKDIQKERDDMEIALETADQLRARDQEKYEESQIEIKRLNGLVEDRSDRTNEFRVALETSKGQLTQALNDLGARTELLVRTEAELAEARIQMQKAGLTV